jgi:hypothetical protein
MWFAKPFTVYSRSDEQGAGSRPTAHQYTNQPMQPALCDVASKLLHVLTGSIHS